MYCQRCGKEPQGNPCTNCGLKDPLAWLADLRNQVAFAGSVDAILTGSGGPHTHPESQVTGLSADLSSKAPADHTHAGGAEHPDLATHEALGLALDDHAHAPTAHVHAENATDADLATHAATAHGTSSHAISGVMHSGTLDHSALGSVTANQHHNQAHALGGADHSGSLAQSSVTNLTTDLAGKASTTHGHVIADTTNLQSSIDGKAATGHNHDAAYAHTHPYAATSHQHADGDLPAGLARDAEVTAAVAAHAATPHGGSSSAPVHTVLADGSTAMGLGTNDSVRVTPTANATYTSTVPVAGSRRTILVLTSGATSRTITFGTGFKPVGTLATGTTTARVFVVSWISDGTNLYEASRTAAMVA